MTEIQGHHADGCLMCAVRALTEGRAKIWDNREPGAEVTGVVLRQGIQPSDFGEVPFIELWLGGFERTRILAYSSMLASLIEGAELRVGDTVTVRYVGQIEVPATHRFYKPGRTMKKFELAVERGH